MHLKDLSETLHEQGQSSYRSAVGKIGWLCAHSRPDLSFDYIDLSSKFGKATVKDMKSVSKLTQKLKADTFVKRLQTCPLKWSIFHLLFQT